MYPFYYPQSTYTPSYPSSAIDADYYRALAEERAAREQYAAARRAQEEARQRAARARAARRAYASPYNSFHDDDNGLDLDMDLDDGSYYSRQRPLSFAASQPYGSPSAIPQYSSIPFGLDPREQRALLEEQRRRELLGEQRRRELLELELERRRQEEERLRRILQEEREREEAQRRRILEEERARRALEEEKLRRAVEEERLRRAVLEEEAARRERERTPLKPQQATLEPLLRALGFVPIGSDSESDKERPTRDTRTAQNLRAHTTSPAPRRAGGSPPSPIRLSKSGRPSTSPVSSFAETSAPATSIPIMSPKPSPKPTPAQSPRDEKLKSPKPSISSLDTPTPEQVAAAEKIQDAYRTHSARKTALKSIATLRKRFLSAKSSFTLPATLDYEVPSAASTTPGEGRAHVTVTVDPLAQLPSPSPHDADPFQHVPKLAYTPTNTPVHAYEEELSRILSALDAIESRGDAGVRAARRELARMVEREAERVERWRGVVWNWWVGRATAQEPSESATEDAPQTVEQGVSDVPKEQEMQVEPSVSESVTSPKTSSMEVEPEPKAGVDASPIPIASDNVASVPAAVSIPIATPAPAQLSVAAPAEQPPTPEIDIPDADVDAPAPLIDIDVEPPSRAEPAVPDDVDVDSAAPATIPEAPMVEEPEDASSTPRPSTPLLAHDHSSEADAAMDIEPHEVHTPPPLAHTPLVVVDPSAGDVNEANKVCEERLDPLPAPKGSASPLPDNTSDEFRACDTFRV